MLGVKGLESGRPYSGQNAYRVEVRVPPCGTRLGPPYWSAYVPKSWYACVCAPAPWKGTTNKAAIRAAVGDARIGYLPSRTIDYLPPMVSKPPNFAIVN